jgi:hypothetical protein
MSALRELDIHKLNNNKEPQANLLHEKHTQNSEHTQTPTSKRPNRSNKGSIFRKEKPKHRETPHKMS